jgi:hypothetical protein
MCKLISIAVVLWSVASFNPAMAKSIVRHHRPHHAQAPIAYHAIPYGGRTGYRYDWQAGDCDIANKTALNTCSNGGL